MISRAMLFLAAAHLLAAPHSALAQCQDWHAGPMDNGGGVIGTDGTVYALTSWDPDGAGPLPQTLVAGGVFTQVCGVSAPEVAYIDPATGQWHATATGPGLQAVFALTTYQGNLVAGGVQPGGLPTGTIRWNGSSWVAMDLDYCVRGIVNMTPQDVRCFGFYGDTLIAGGELLQWDGVNDPCGGSYGYGLAAWVGNTNWENKPYNVTAYVKAVAQAGGQLYVAGYATPPHVNPQKISAWDGTTWHAMGGGLNDEVRALTLYNGSLIAGGVFTTSQAGGPSYSHIASWDGSNWHAVGIGVSDTVACLAVYNGELIAGGSFTSAGGVPAAHIARWNGAIWQPLGGGTDGYVRCLAVLNGELIAGGDFLNADGHPVNHLARWNGYQWAAYGGGSVSGVSAMTTYLGRLVAGGNFQQSTPGNQAAHNIAAWDGVQLYPYDAGTDGTVNALKAFKYSGSHGANELIAAGSFSHAGSVSATNIARWDQTFNLLPPPAWQAMGAGLAGPVNAIERFNNVTYAGGSFTLSGGTTVNCIAQWNDASSSWLPVGSGMNGPVYALKVFNGALYAGGAFTAAGGFSTGGLAMWNGSTWSAVGGLYLLGSVYALEIHNGQLVIGGDFTGVGTSPDLVEWSGLGFTSLGTSGTNGFVRSLVSTGTRLYAGGSFSSVGGITASNEAYWDGAWHAVSGGADSWVTALASFAGEIQSGGVFSTVRAGSLASPGWARYSESGIPWFAYQPNSPNVNQGDDTVIGTQPASGYGPLTYRWYRNGVALNDGSSIGGSVIGGSSSPTLTIHGATHYDEGSYFLVIGNSCGSDTSSTGTLTVVWTTGVPIAGGAGVTSLERLAPNPSPGPTLLDFALAREGDVRIRIHDVAGRTVRTLDLGTLSAGHHESSWDGLEDSGSRARAGVYFVALEVEGRRAGERQVAIVR